MFLHGIIPPVATPFHGDESLDLPRLKWYLDYLLKQRVHALFVLGTNSEFYALEESEKQAVVAAAVEHVRGRVPLVAGTGAQSTREVIRLTKMAEREGADAVSVITPYFVQPTQDELATHYRRVVESTKLPVMLYNNPKPCGGVRLLPETVAKLAEDCPAILAIKDSSGDLQNTLDYIRMVPDRVGVFQGTDTLIYASLACGARGAVAASANVAAALCVEIYEAFRRGDASAALAAQHSLHPIRQAIMQTTAPGGPKAALRLLGVDLGPCRGPLLAPIGPTLDRLKAALRQAGLLQSGPVG